MTWTKTVTYWLLFAVLGGYYWVFEREAQPPATPEVRREKVLPVFRDEVRAVVMRREGKAVRAEIDDKRWRIVSPEGVSIPSDLVTALIDTLAERQEAEVVEESPKEGELGAFGLDAPASTLEIELANGTTRTIEVGHRNPTRTAVYVRTSGSPRVLLAGLNVQYYGDLLFEAAHPRVAGSAPESGSTSE
ncbi:MAG: DUF4340 domain-containing protein [Candidatus Binatia bacterium]